MACCSSLLLAISGALGTCRPAAAAALILCHDRHLPAEAVMRCAAANALRQPVTARQPS